MRFSQTVKLLLLLIIASACNTGPDLRRDNENDPEAKNYKPDIALISAAILENKDVVVTWQDKSNFEDGFLVSKSLGDNKSYTIIDTLSPNSTSYTDDSKQLDRTTYYKISAFSENSDSLESNTLAVAVDYGIFSDVIVQVSNGNTLTVSWDNSESYADQVLIEKNNKGEVNWVKIDSIDGSNNNFTYSDNDNIYKLQIRLTARILNYDGNLQKTHNAFSDTVYLNFPTNFNIDLINEAQANVTFDDVSEFDDKFIVYERTRTAWHQPFSGFVPIDTIPNSGTIFISNNDNNNREYTVAGIYQNKKSAFSEPINLEFIPAVPYVEENAFTSVSTTSVGISWVDGNNEPGRPSTYQFEIYLYNSETSELLREIFIPPSERDYTIEDLNPSIKYEFVLKTYNSHTPDPTPFSVQTALEKIEEYFLSRNDGINVSKILADQKLIIYSSYQYGKSGLNVFNLDTKTSQIIPDTGEDPAEYENKVIEGFAITENLELIATLRFKEVIDGFNPYFLYVADRSSNTPSYFKKEINLNHWDEEVEIIGFISKTELIYVRTNPTTDDGLKIFKWNFNSGQTEAIFETEIYYHTSSYIDDDKIFIGTINSLFILNKDGSVYQAVQDPQLGHVKSIISSHQNDSYYLNISDRLFRYNLATNQIERISSIDRVEKFLVLPEHNTILVRKRTSDDLFFLDISTGSEIFLLPDDDDAIYRFREAAYLPDRDQLVFQYGERVIVFSLSNDWVITSN